MVEEIVGFSIVSLNLSVCSILLFFFFLFVCSVVLFESLWGVKRTHTHTHTHYAISLILFYSIHLFDATIQIEIYYSIRIELNIKCHLNI